MKSLLVIGLAALLAIPAVASAREQRVLCPSCNSLLSYMDDPAWWAQNPVALNSQIQACVNKHPGSEPLMRYCGPATRGLQLVRATRSLKVGGR